MSQTTTAISKQMAENKFDIENLMSTTSDIKKLDEERHIVADFSFPMEQDKWTEALNVLNSGFATVLNVILIDLFDLNVEDFSLESKRLQLIEEEAEKSMAILNDILFGLIEKKLSNKLKKIILFNVNFKDDFFKRMDLFQNLCVFKTTSITGPAFLALLKNKKIERLDIGSCDSNINLKEFKEFLSVSSIKYLTLKKCRIIDDLVEILATSSTLIRLDISSNSFITSKALEALAQSSIKELVMEDSPQDQESIISIIRANKLQYLYNPLGNFCFFDDRYYYSKETCERLKKALKENTSLLLVGTSLDLEEKWHSTCVCPLTEPRNDVENNLVEKLLKDRVESIPPRLFDPDMQWKSYYKLYVYSERNVALKEACERKEVLNQIQTLIRDRLRSLSVEPASILSETITSYARPIGKELLTAFNLSQAIEFFPEQFHILKKFGYYSFKLTC